MSKAQEVFLKALTTAEELSVLAVDLLERKKHEQALNVLENRGRVVNIVLHLDEQLRASGKNNEIKDEQTARLLRSINALDREIFDLLVEEKLVTQNEIAKTRKNKENFKGYNLNDLK